MSNGDLVPLNNKWRGYVDKQMLFASPSWDRIQEIYWVLQNVQIVGSVGDMYFINDVDQQKELERLRGSKSIVYYIVPKPK